MNDLVQQILGYLRGMWHRRWIGLGAAWLAAVIGVVLVYRIPEKYEASARVYVDTESLLRPLLAGLAIQPNVDQQVALMSRTLVSRPNIEKLVRMADLDLAVKNTAARDELIDNVMRSIGLSGSANNLYTIGYRDPNPEQARKVVQSLLAIFVESSLGDKRQDSRVAVRFLDDQIKRYEETLKASENRLKDFKIRHLGMGGAGQDYFSRLGALQGAIENGKLELEASQKARDAYKQELVGETATYLPEDSATPADEGVPEYDGRIAGLKRELDDLLRKYTDQHPDVMSTKRLLGQLESERQAQLDARHKAEAAAGPKPIRSFSVERNPMFQQLRMSLAESEANVASMRAKLGAYENQYMALRAQAQLVPQIEAEFTALNRDYDVQKRTYESLLTRREQGAMGIDVQDAGAAQFRVIDPPRVSPHPVAPNRLGLLGLALVGSIGAGLAAAFLASQVMPIFHNAVALREVTKRPILGMVSMLPSEALTRIRKRGAYLFAGGVGSLFAAFAGVFAFALLVGRI
jgi:protein tyrosine kinase modulator